jgi:hypothetical protein
VSLHLRFARALAAIRQVTKTQTADTGKYTYTYADLGDVLEECKRALAEQDLVLSQVPSYDDGMLTVTAMIYTTAEEDVDVPITFPAMGMKLPSDAQAYGSALTYARRYQLLTIFGIAPEDDDGKEATTAARTAPGARTEAERTIREEIGKMDRDTRTRFAAEFRQQFGSILAELPNRRHGDALTWTMAWVQDEQWRREAQQNDRAEAEAPNQ